MLFVRARCPSGYWRYRKNQDKTTLCYSVGALAVTSVFSWDLFCLTAQQIDKKDQVCLWQGDKLSLVSHLGTPRKRKEIHTLSIPSHFIWIGASHKFPCAEGHELSCFIKLGKLEQSHAKWPDQAHVLGPVSSTSLSSDKLSTGLRLIWVAKSKLIVRVFTLVI